MIPAPPPSRRHLWFSAVLVSVLFLTFFLATRPKRHGVPSVTLAEVHRTNLQLRAEGWFAPGDTRAFTGFLLDTYDDGTLKSRSSISNGVLHGLSQGWHTNGQQQVEEHYVAGVSHGMRTKWHPNGRKLSEATIVNGKLQGPFQSWHENGVPAEQVELKDGQPNGLSKSYFPSGSLKSQVTLHNGKVLEQHFYKDGEHRPPSPANL